MLERGSLREWSAAPLSTCQRMHPSTCTSALALLLVKSSRLCWRSLLWWTILASLLCLNAASAMTKVFITFACWTLVFFLSLLVFVLLFNWDVFLNEVFFFYLYLYLQFIFVSCLMMSIPSACVWMLDPMRKSWVLFWKRTKLEKSMWV